MPELPEVETVARQLDPELRGRRIVRLEVLDGRWSRPVPPGELGDAVSGRTIRGLGRRGKYLLLGLDREQTLVMHLRMTGNLVLVEGDRVLDPSEGRRLYEAERSTSARHLRARFALDDGRELWFTDPRRFGEAFLIDDADLEHHEALRDAVVAALEAGIENGGSSIDDYRDGRGEKGTMQDEFLVHTREGEPCPECESEIVRIVVGGRSTYYCPSCQVRLRRKPRRRVR
jgi:formamidopyrimidine-DNA glycosylase